MNAQHLLFEPLESMTRERLIERILEINPSATAAFLGEFEHGALARYLGHLISAEAPRGREARWVRPTETPAIVGRDSRI